MFKEDKDERKFCEGCLTGNYFLCSSFPGKAEGHAAREIQYRKYHARRRPSDYRRHQNLVYRREQE